MRARRARSGRPRCSPPPRSWTTSSPLPTTTSNDVAPLDEKWAAFGWNVIEVEDGNDVDQVSEAVKHAKLGLGSGKPTMVILNTKKGCGVKWIEDLGPANHNTNISEEQAQAAIAEIRGEV